MPKTNVDDEMCRNAVWTIIKNGHSWRIRREGDRIFLKPLTPMAPMPKPRRKKAKTKKM